LPKKSSSLRVAACSLGHLDGNAFRNKEKYKIIKQCDPHPVENKKKPTPTPNLFHDLSTDVPSTLTTPTKPRVILLAGPTS
jgi:hypothetical protein